MTSNNIFLEKWTTPHEAVPFDKIKIEDYEPAMMEGMRLHKEEIEAIRDNAETPTFANTIEALERSGKILDRVTTVFGCLMSADTSDEMQAVAEKMMPQLTEHSNNISLDARLFERVKHVWENKDEYNLNDEQQMLLRDTFRGFLRSGASLCDEDKQQFRQLSNKKSLLTLKFSQNLLKETHAYALELTLEQLKGIPEDIIGIYKANAEERGKQGYIVTLDAPSYFPFMKYADSRELREEIHHAYMTRCAGAGDYDNKEIVRELVNTRRQTAKLLGYTCYADYVLQERMAENKENVYELLDKLLEAYTPTAKEELAAVEALAREEQGEGFQLRPWDFGYYSRKLKERDYAIDDTMLKPYFKLENVIDGVFGLATRLYGISFDERKDIPVFHPDVKVYEVKDVDGSFLALLYTDFHPRESKRGGAWMTSFKEQWKENDKDSRPHVSVTMNFTKSTADKPSLLTFSEVETFLHEFGHALHGMFASGSYASLSGTNVFWDFVELPSQFMENYAVEEEFLRTFARHYKTGETIPAELVEKIKKSSNFNAGYACLRQLSFGYLDMAWYTREEDFEGDIFKYERDAWQKAILIPEAGDSLMTVQFSHIMAGGYAAGYYSYKWAEVLDADAFSLFKENGIFDRATAQKFRRELLSKGGTEHPAKLYEAFRGRKPSIDALLKRNGIKK